VHRRGHGGRHARRLRPQRLADAREGGGGRRRLRPASVIHGPGRGGMSVQDYPYDQRTRERRPPSAPFSDGPYRPTDAGGRRPTGRRRFAAIATGVLGAAAALLGATWVIRKSAWLAEYGGDDGA